MRGFGLRRRKTTVGVDIGSGFSKAAVIDHGESGPRLTGIATAPHEPDTVGGGTIRDPERVSDTLSALFKRERIKPRNVTIGIGGRDVVSKVIEIDRMDEAEARAVMPWEAEQHVPFDMKNAELDFAIIDPNGEGTTMTVLLAAAKRDVIEARVAVLRRADLNPTIVDVEVLALRNAFEANYPAAMRDVTVLADIGVHSTAIHLLRNGLPLVTRELAVGAPAADELEEFARRIARGIDRTGALVETGPGIAGVYLCGGGATVSGLVEILGEATGVETLLASAFERIEVAPDVGDRTDLGSVAPMLMLSVGLALRPPARGG
ncbi:MAG: type IV pilus assembly protein PilM [Gemmatimonadales bacterium]|nr:type IV pilus assembly protein PilM [Gemmatimonadales bacterium]MYG19173.1 type IV pilus assembly protein PilM [Gemmatimonadales bacterium]